MIFFAISALLFLSNGCVEFKCYPAADLAIEKAHKFCSRGDGDSSLCKTLEVDGLTCGITKDNSCMALENGIKTFIKIPYSECVQLDQKRCIENKLCSWTFSDPLIGAYSDFFRR